ncbi:MAG TPA: methylmalonyl Co-A mutase-associated GTPase MeaB [Desertimonas sp.]|nr:methylmalonyl Co-A mutase-associated GTPase MeaB [Desertimonas sp.]
MAVDLDSLVDGVRAGDRSMLGRAITLVESTRADHQRRAQELLTRLLPHAGAAQRIGVSGVPGAGKSTFIDAVGMRLVDSAHRVAVLAVDPSSSRSGGSILGDKTRMARLGTVDGAFIRPSPTAGRLGGVTRATRQAIVVVEAAGFDVVFVETVGVGQSEAAVAGMVDTFLLLTLARTGDSLQGIKKGVLELADVIAVNKADGDRRGEAAAAANELSLALHLVAPSPGGWSPPVLTCSAMEGDGLDEVWRQITAHRAHLEHHGSLGEHRREQDVQWMWATIDDHLLARFRAVPAVRRQTAEIEMAVREGTMTAAAAAEALLALTDPADPT